MQPLCKCTARRLVPCIIAKDKGALLCFLLSFFSFSLFLPLHRSVSLSLSLPPPSLFISLLPPLPLLLSPSHVRLFIRIPSAYTIFCIVYAVCTRDSTVFRCLLLLKYLSYNLVESTKARGRRRHPRNIV